MKKAARIVGVLLAGVLLGLVLANLPPHFSVGGVAPDFTARDQEGKSFKLSEYRGKVVVLDFWGFW
jgi:cytochrome oxidase Cu insertion factor (SCO1/SenC/PrrC family)